MSPQVAAAVIAASVGVLTLIATVVTQYLGRRATSRDTQKALDVQRDQLKTTIAAQREQLYRTLSEQRTRTLNERFTAAAGLLGDDKPPTVRLVGLYAMAGLADDWPENRQTCVEVLCAYLRMPYEPDPGDEALESERLVFLANREVRHTVIRVIAAHLEDGTAMSWQGLNFDFTGVVFDGADFRDAVFSDGWVSFLGAEFSGEEVSFERAVFSGSRVNFREAKFSDGAVYFSDAHFSAGRVDFRHAQFSDGTVYFADAQFSGGQVDFRRAEFSGSRVDFRRAEFSGGQVDFRGAWFSGGTVDLYDAWFSGGIVDFSMPGDWLFPPTVRWADALLGVRLPSEEDLSQA